MEDTATKGVVQEASDVYQIDVEASNPFELFKKWMHDAEEAGVIMPSILHLATSDGCGRVSARALMLRQLDPDGFVVMTDSRSKKAFDLARCPRAAMTFLWNIARTPSGFLSRQVRIEGVVKQKSFDDYMHLYTGEPLYCKIRSTICRQGEFIEWSELKESHDRLFAECSDSKATSLNQPPPHYAVYKMYPDMIEFYAATDNTIADRVVFRRDAKLIPRRAHGTNKNGTNGTNGTNGAGATSGSSEDAPELTQDESLCQTFSNGLQIDVGYKKESISEQEKKQANENWVHYNIAA